MPNYFYALEANTLSGYIQAQKDIRSAMVGMSHKDISEAKKEIAASSNIFALPEEVDLEGFKMPELFELDADGNANIPVRGILSTQVDWCAAYFQETTTTYGFIRAAAIKADNDSRVTGKIRLRMETPGGIITDLDETSQVLFNLKKPTETIGSGMIASAGYYLASQTDSITVNSPSVFVGSIGVAVEFIDRSKLDDERGVKRVTLTSTDAPDKRPDLSTTNGQKSLIRELDALHNIFVSRIVQGRNKNDSAFTNKIVNETFGKGAVLIASEAMDAGMIDGVELEIQDTINIETTKHKHKKSTSNSASKATTQAAANQNPNPKVKMDLTQFLTENPTAQKELDSMIATAKTEATATLQAKIDKVVPFIGNTNYPGIASMCSKVLKNESEFSTLEGAVTAFDMIEQKAKSKDATAETEKTGETKAEDNAGPTNGMVNSDQDMDAIVEKTKQSIEG